MPKTIVFIGKSLDGFIAGPKGELDWLDSIPNPNGESMGYVELMSEVDAILMGRNTFETVLKFGGEWPYEKHVYILSGHLKSIPEELKDRVSIVSGELRKVLLEIRGDGNRNLYIDGGKTIQNFLKEDLIDELRITTIPILLGSGTPLFEFIPKSLKFDHIKTEVFLKQIVQSHYRRSR